MIRRAEFSRRLWSPGPGAGARRLLERLSDADLWSCSPAAGSAPVYNSRLRAHGAARRVPDRRGVESSWGRGSRLFDEDLRLVSRRPSIRSRWRRTRSMRKRARGGCAGTGSGAPSLDTEAERAPFIDAGLEPWVEEVPHTHPSGTPTEIWGNRTRRALNTGADPYFPRRHRPPTILGVVRRRGESEVPNLSAGETCHVSPADALMTANLSASWARAVISSLANTCARCVCTVRPDTLQALADLGIGQALGDQAGDRVSAESRFQQPPIRPAGRAGSLPAQRRLNEPPVTRGVEPLRDPHCFIEQRAGAVHLPSPLANAGAGVLAGRARARGDGTRVRRRPRRLGGSRRRSRPGPGRWQGRSGHPWRLVA